MMSTASSIFKNMLESISTIPSKEQRQQIYQQSIKAREQSLAYSDPNDPKDLLSKIDCKNPRFTDTIFATRLDLAIFKDEKYAVFITREPIFIGGSMGVNCVPVKPVSINLFDTDEKITEARLRDFIEWRNENKLNILKAYMHCLEQFMDTEEKNIVTQDGIVRLPEGVYFDLQGLQIFMNNEGELLIQGAQTDFTKPIFLSSKKSIVLHSVEASFLKLTAPSVVGVGKSSIDFLALEGLMSAEGEEVAATYINTGSLSAKEVFLKNLILTNTGTLTTDGFEAEGGIFRNTGTLAMSADAQSGNRAFTGTTVINDGNIEGLHYNIAGSSFTQNGRLKGRVLSVGKDTSFTTGAHQELTLSEHLDSASTTRWKLTGTVNVHEFNHLGAIDLEGTLNTTNFTGHGTVQPTGTFTSERSHFTDAFINLGQVSTHVLDADAALTTNGLMRVSSAAEIRGKFKVGAKGRFEGIEDESLSLTCHDASIIAGKVDVDSLSTAKAISVKGKGKLIARQFATLAGQLTIQPKSVVSFKGLKANGAFIENHGTLTVEGIETGAAGLTLTNAGTAHIDAEQVLPRASEDDPENTARVAAILPIDAEFIVRGEEARTDAIEDRALLAYQQIQRIPVNPIITPWNASVFYSSSVSKAVEQAFEDIVVSGTGAAMRASLFSGITELQRRKDAGDLVAKSFLSKGVPFTNRDLMQLIGQYNNDLKIQQLAYAVGETYMSSAELETSLKEKNKIKNVAFEDIVVSGTGAAMRASLFSGITELQRRKDAGDLVAKSFLSKGVPFTNRDLMQLIGQYNNNIKMQRILEAANCKTMRFYDLATECLETISTLPSHKRGALLTAMQERVNLVAPMYLRILESIESWYLGRVGFSDSTSPNTFAEQRTNVVAQIQTDVDITMQQLQDIADCKAFMPAVRPIKLNFTNQATGQVTLKSGRFDFVEDTAFSNDGTLVQDHACLHWITGLPGAFNTGTWAVKGSLGLVGYKAEDVGNLEIEETLHVHTTEDALKALGSMSKVKAGKIVMHAPQLRHTTATEMVLPWVLELHLDEDFSSVGNIATCGLQLFCKGFDGNADLAAGIQDGVDITSEEQGFLKVTATENVKLGVNGYFYGKKGVGVKAKNLAVEGRQAVPGAGAPSILYKRSGNGLYSEEGPVVIDTEGTFHNNFGTISALYYIIKGKVFHNIAGLLQGKDATQQSQIIAETVRSVREVPNTQSAYGCPGHPWRKTHTFHGDSTGVDKCGGLGCRPSYTNYETSLQSVIEHAGDLEIIYRTLVNEVSDISSSKSVFLDARSADQTLNVGDAGTRIQLEENQLLRTATPHQGVTAIWDRNGHTSLIRGKQGISGTLGSAHLEGGMRGNSIALRAAEMTFQNMQLNKKQAASLLNLAQSIQNGGSSIYKRLGNTEVFDTRFQLSSGQYPHSIVAMGAMPQKIDLWATWGAFEYAFGQNFPYLYRGLDYLGISFAQLCEITAEEVRSRAGSEVRRHLIEDSKGCYEIDVVTHPELMTASDLKKSPLPMLVVEFGRNASRAEDDMLREQQAEIAKAKGKSLSERAQELLKAAHTQPKAQFDISLVVPAEEDSRSGIFTTQGRNDITVTEGDFVSRGITVSGHDGSISAPKGKVKILSEAVTVGDSDNFHQVLNRATVENKGTGDFLVACADDVELEGTIFDTQVPGSSITLHTPKRIIDSAKGAASRQTSHSTGKKSGKRVSTTTVADSLIMHPTKAMGQGTVNMRAGSGVSLQAPDVSCVVKVDAPFLEFTEAHNQFSSRSNTTIQGKRGICGGSGSKKSISSLTQAFHSLGGKLKGSEFIAHVEHCSMTNVLFDTPHAVIHAREVEFPAGTNSSSSQTRTMYNGAMWNVHKMQSESHTTRSPCQFKQPVTVHGQKATVEQRPGSAPVSNLITTNPITYLDVLDHHDSSSKSQKSLSAGAALIVRLAVTLPMLLNPATFGLSGTYGVMANAGYGTLCSELWVNMIEQDGNVGRALKAMEKKDIVLSVARSMATAGLTKELGDAIGVKTGFELGKNGKILERAFGDYAKAAVLNSAVNTMMSVAIDGQDVGEALKQGIAMAGINTLASYGAGKIGDLYMATVTDRINYVTHKALHGILGAGMGATLAAVTHTDPKIGALSSAFGAVLSEMVAEGFSPAQADMDQYLRDHPDAKKEQLEADFMTKATKTANWGAFAGALGTFGIGLDASIGHSAARNAVDNNLLPHLVWLALYTYASFEYLHFVKDMKAEGVKTALGKLGIRVIEDATIVMAIEIGVAAAPLLFEVGGVVCKTLGEALKLVRANPTITKELQGSCTAIERNLPEMEQLVQVLRPTASGGAGGVPEVGTQFARLEAPQMADHHIFPQQFKKYFSDRSINIDLHTVSVPHQTTHLRGLHGKGYGNMPGGWNQRWKTFIEATPNATSKDIYQFAGQLMDEYGINNLRLHGYKL
jgi:hypothetical protein